MAEEEARERAPQSAQQPAGPAKNSGWPLRRRREKRGRWWEKYLPFVARGLEKQVEWLLAAFRRQTLTDEELRPYVALLLEDDHPESREELRGLLAGIGGAMWCRLLAASSVEDLPTLIGLMPRLGVEEAIVALRASPPPYVAAPALLLDAVHEALHYKDAGVYEEAVRRLLASEAPPAHLPEAHARFAELLRDRELLSSLFPRARK